MPEHSPESAGSPPQHPDTQLLPPEPIPWHPEKLAGEADFYAFYGQAADEQTNYAQNCLSVTVHSSFYTLIGASFAGLVKVGSEVIETHDPLLNVMLDDIFEKMQAFGTTTATIAGALAVGTWFLARLKIAEARHVSRQALDDELRTMPPPAS